MYNKITYNVEFKPRPRKSMYNMGRAVTHDFLASDHKNVCLEYSNAKEVKNVCQALWYYAKQNRQPLKFSVRGNSIIITRKDKE